MLITQVHQESRGTYGDLRIHAELPMGLGLRISRTRVARLTGNSVIHGVSHHRQRKHRPDSATQDDVAKRQFSADGPDWVGLPTSPNTAHVMDGSLAAQLSTRSAARSWA